METPHIHQPSLAPLTFLYRVFCGQDNQEAKRVLCPLDSTGGMGETLSRQVGLRGVGRGGGDHCTRPSEMIKPLRRASLVTMSHTGLEHRGSHKQATRISSCLKLYPSSAQNLSSTICATLLPTWSSNVRRTPVIYELETENV